MSNEPEQKPISKQRQWQLKKQAEGKCVTCGSGSLVSKQHCEKHLLEARARNRARMGCGQWVPGGPGRPPKYSATNK